MWGRGRIDHIGLAAASAQAFQIIRDRLAAAGASDGTVNDFGGALSIFFRDPDGLEGEVLLRNRDRPVPEGSHSRRGAVHGPGARP